MGDTRWSTLLLLLFASSNLVAQVAPQKQTLTVNGQTGQAATVQINGRTYIDLDSLARLTSGSVNYAGDRMVVTLPTSAGNAPAASAGPSQEDNSRLSHDFQKAGIESIAEMREWASTLGYAIQNGYNVTESWVANYREKAAHSLQMASAAATTEADRSGLQLLNNEFAFVREWSETLVKEKQSMDTGKYSTSPDSLRNDPRSQKIIACGHFLASMLGSGGFQEDASCH